MEKAFLEMLNANRALIFKVCNMNYSDHERRRVLYKLGTFKTGRKQVSKMITKNLKRLPQHRITNDITTY